MNTWIVSEWVPFLMSGINHPLPPLSPPFRAAPPEKSDDFDTSAPKVRRASRKV